MTTLADFLEPIKVAGRPLAENCKGYLMDGTYSLNRLTA